jgi:hypothetical protein
MRSIMKEIKVIKISDWEIDELIRNLGISGYNCVEDNEWVNDTCHLMQHVNAEELTEDDEKEIKEAIGVGEAGWNSTRMFMCYLAKLGDIPSGDYLVEVCWW